jgi:hypothetical protein
MALLVYVIAITISDKSSLLLNFNPQPKQLVA